MTDAIRRSDCRYCGSKDLELFLSLGDQPPSNSFIPPDLVESEQSFPLDVYLCKGCYLTQLLDVVPAGEIFDEYLYLSSTSRALKAHYAQLAGYLTERMNLRTGDVVLDIGCNDGILLNGYSLEGLVRVGVEPSVVGEIAMQGGLDVYRSFFGADVARAITSDHGKVKVVTATNVFAHVDDIGAFVDGVGDLLDDEGIFVIESPYVVNLIDEALFDTIYHEHLCYLGLTPLVPFLARHGLEVFDVERVPFGASGPAIRVFSQLSRGSRPVSDAVRSMIEAERVWGIADISTYSGYAAKVHEVRARLLAMIGELLGQGARLAAYGAPAKGNTLLNFLGLSIEQLEFVAETNERKQGLLTPGSHIPIISEEAFLEKMPEYALLLTWNYLDFFLKNSDYIRKGGRFIVPLPTPRIEPDPAE